MIFIVPCKYNPACLVEKTIESIRKYHPTDKIVLVDSDSEDKSYFDRVSQYEIQIEDVGNKNYEPGALWYVTSLDCNSEHYVLLQDSMVLNTKLTDVGDFKAFINFQESTFHNHMRLGFSEYVMGINNLMGKIKPLEMKDKIFTGVFGSSFIVSNKIIDAFYAFGWNDSLLPTNKTEHQFAERAFGLAVEHLGIDLTKNTLIGNLHELMSSPAFNRETETLYTNILSKTWINKHRQ